MQKEIYQQYCDKLYSSKSRKEFDDVCAEIKIATENDEQARTALRNYLSKIKDRKFQYFEKYPPNENKKQFPIKKTVLLDEQLSKKIEKYYDLLILEKKLELKNKYNINLN